MNRKLPRPFEIYRHFKGNHYQIICMARDADTGEDMVVYQALYGEYACYTRPLCQFLSETDREKYPDAQQKYRFQEISVQESLKSSEINSHVQSAVKSPEGEEQSSQENSHKTAEKSNLQLEIAEPKPGEADPALLAFLDADSMEEKSNILVSIRHRITDRLIDDFAVTLDVVIPEGSVDVRYQQLLNSIRMVQKYEIERAW
ncbi:MAG: DUF1653 domain-containing protein [Lachnospiraceae bacterium]|nr:DUF1653 domain-containing protein [Lachnospiraceae bacterium]MDE6981321.1 DUF1653 domain-containing protein [Lachnospiraceae bacterium]